MKTSPITLAVFDFDGTLTSGHFWTGLAAHHRAHRMKRLAVYTYLLGHLPLYLASKAKLVSQERNHRQWGQDIVTLLKGLTPAEVSRVYDWVMDHYFQSRLRPEILQKLKEHAAQGYQTMILSGVLVDFLEVVRAKLDIDYAVGTRPAIRDGRYTGRIVTPLCFGAQKARALADFIQSQNLTVDLKQSWAYADSIYDAPLLETIGHPVAVYPDEKLAKLAHARKWTIIE
jgi:HAD superfamily hydrolase (TIGR01490 family)